MITALDYRKIEGTQEYRLWAGGQGLGVSNRSVWMTPEGADKDSALSLADSPRLCPHLQGTHPENLLLDRGHSWTSRGSKGPQGGGQGCARQRVGTQPGGGGGASLGAGQGAVSLPGHRGILMSFLARSDGAGGDGVMKTDDPRPAPCSSSCWREGGGRCGRAPCCGWQLPMPPPPSPCPQLSPPSCPSLG